VSDGDTATEWSTDRYHGRDFGGLKSGVGLWLRFDGERSFTKLTVRSAVRGWGAAVYVAPQPAALLSGWGEPVATVSEVRGDREIDLRGAAGQAVLVWFTDPGSTNQMSVGEIVVEGR
jgi:hypothetical protein